MAKIKEQISEFRKSTPKHIQWLLLAAAFIVVLILLTLLFTGRKDTQIIPNLDTDNATEITFSPVMLDWGKTPIGETKTTDVAISATNPILVKIGYTEKVDGFTVKSACENLEISSRLTKCIQLTYAPVAPMADKKIILTVTWRTKDAREEMQHTAEYYVTLGATGTAIAEKKTERQVVSTPAPKPEPEPAPKPVVDTDIDDDIDTVKDTDVDVDTDIDTDVDIDVDDDVIDAPMPLSTKPVANEIRDDIKSIAPSDPFASAKSTNVSDDTPVAPEACSDFAIPGYGTSGRQIGWIKPERGAYYFHPFSDKECNNPTGIYNPDNGIITDIKSNGKRIGTDAEHIGYSMITNGTLPTLSSNPATKKTSSNSPTYNAEPYTDKSEPLPDVVSTPDAFGYRIGLSAPEIKPETYLGSSDSFVLSSQPYDRQFILRQYKPIPATIVSEVRADPSLYSDAKSIQLPVRATVDRNVYADDGRNIILPTGTLMLGYVTGTLPGPYTAVGRMQIKWYQFILPNGVEFNFKEGQDPISGDSQGRMGVPGRGSTDYLEQFVMPMLTAIVPAAVNMISPIADKFVNQIDLDNNTVVQSGTMRSSELAKNEIITAWNQVANKLLVDMMDNTTPPFSIAAGTRITVYSPEDLIVSCGEGNGKKCSLGYGQNKRRQTSSFGRPEPDYNDGSWIGQSRSFSMGEWCETDANGASHAKRDEKTLAEIQQKGYSFSTVEMYCQTQSYQAINNAKQQQYYQNQQQQFQSSYGTTGNQTTEQQKAYNQDVLGLTYEDSGAIVNPFATPEPEPAPEQPATIGCLDGTQPDANGCCTGEIYTDMGEEGWNCCPSTGGDCFPPIK